MICWHDPFGRASLPAESVEALRRDIVLRQSLDRLVRVAKRLVDSADADDRAVGEALRTWIARGGNMAKALGVVGRRGKHRLRVVPHHDEDTAPEAAVRSLPTP